MIGAGAGSIPCVKQFPCRVGYNLPTSTLFQAHKTYPADDACPSALCKGAAGARPTGGEQADDLDGTVLRLQDFDRLAGDVDARAGIGNLAQMRRR